MLSCRESSGNINPVSRWLENHFVFCSLTASRLGSQVNICWRQLSAVLLYQRKRKTTSHGAPLLSLLITQTMTTFTKITFDICVTLSPWRISLSPCLLSGFMMLITEKKYIQDHQDWICWYLKQGKMSYICKRLVLQGFNAYA